MNPAKVLKEEMKRKNKTMRWLYEEVKALQEDTGSYQWFGEKMKTEKLSANDLICIAFVLDVDLRKFTALLKNKEMKKSQAENHWTEYEKEIIRQSEYKDLEAAKREFTELDGKTYLLTFSKHEDAEVLEWFDAKEKTKRVHTRLDGFSSMGDIAFESIEELESYSKEKRFQLVYDHGTDYQTFFDIFYEDECPLQSFE